MTARILLSCIVFLAIAIAATAQQPVVLKRDAGRPHSIGHDTSSLPMWEETVTLGPAGPCSLLELYVYFTGTTPETDTIWIVGDPSEGALPPTSNVWSYNALADPIIVHYDGTPGWDTIDMRAAKLHYDGYDRVVVQHRLKPEGPWFAIDSNGAGGASVLYDPFNFPSPDFPILGRYLLARGDFMVRALITYDFPNGTSSASAPKATMADVAKTVGLVDTAGRALVGARASVADWNGDGWDDLAIGSRFYQNKGDGTFRDVTNTIGIAAGATVWGDYDNDGHLDCYAANGGAGDRIYHNKGDGTFADATSASGFSNPYPTVTPIWFDYDHDGKLDLYISNGRTSDVSGNEQYFPDQLWRGAGNGTFTNVTEAADINDAEMAGSPAGDTYLDCWGASPCDYDGDGWTDIFVATYRLAPDLLYRNRHDGTFEEKGAATGVRGVPTAEPYYFGHGIGCDWADYDNDGLMDVAVGNLGHPDSRGQYSNPSMVFHHNADAGNTFTEVHRKLGIKFFEMNAAVVWADLDLDGWQDLWHCQYSYNRQGQNGEVRRLSRLYINDGPAAGFHMTDRTWHTGPLIHGAWTAVRTDFDRDGDLDLLVASPTDAVKLFRNSMPRNGSWLAFRLTGSPANSVSMDAYGTSVTVYTGGGMRLVRDLQGGGGGATASQNTNVLHFGIGQNASADSVVVRYPDGTSTTYNSVLGNASYTIPYHGAIVSTSGVQTAPADATGMTLSDVRFAGGDAISFVLQVPPKAPDVQVQLIDVLGGQVASCSIADAVSGPRTVQLGRVVPGGVYFLRAAAGNLSTTSKVSYAR